MRLKIALLLLCVCTVASAINIRVTLNPNPDGVRTTAFPCLDTAGQTDCAPPTTNTLNLDTSGFHLTGLAINNATSFNFSSLISGTCSGTATWTLKQASGDNYATENWTVSTTTLAHPSNTDTGAGSFYLTGTCSSNARDFGPISWSYSSFATDTTAPTMPTGISVVLDASNHPVISFDPPCDNVDLSTYTVKRDGVGLTPVSFSSQPTIAALTSSDVTTMSPAGTTTLSNSYDYLDTAEGDLASTTDEFRFSQRQVAGDFCMTAKVESFTNAVSAFAKAALMAHDGLTSGNIYVDAQVRANGATKIEYRTAAGSARQTVGGTTADSFPIWQQLCRTGDSWTVNKSTDGGAWTAVTSQTVALPAALNVGIGTTSTSQGNTVTVQYRNFCLRTATRISYTDSAASSGATHSYSVTAKDSTGNTSVASPTISIAVPAVAGVKWHPGHYVKIGASAGVSTTGSEVIRVNDSALILGAEATIYMGKVETSQNSYDWAGSGMDTYVSYMSSHGKHAMFQMLERFCATASTASCVPTYLSSDMYQTSDGKYGLAIWRSSVMDRVIAWTQAFCGRYDTNHSVEALRVPTEVAPSMNIATQPADYSRAALATQLERLWQQAHISCPHTLIVASINNLSGQEAALTDSAVSDPVAFGGTDAINSTGNVYFATAGYAGQIANYQIASGPTLGGKDDNGPATNIINWSQDSTRKVTHLVWLTTSAVAGDTWTDIKAAIAADPNLYTTCPSAYQARGGCDTSN